jgi:hypothetical protein
MISIKHIFSSAILFAAIIFASCSKDQVNNEPKTDSINKTTRQLMNFRQDLFSKNGGSMATDSAEWYLEGLLNFEQANNTHEFAQLQFLYDTLAWPESNGEITMENLQQLYANVNQIAQSMALQNGSPDYTFDIIDLQVIETGLKSGETAVKVTLAGGLTTTTPAYIGFGPTDYWYWGWDAGKCEDFTGQYIGRDAASELQYHFTFAPFQQSYFIDIDEIWAQPWDFPTTDNPYGSYMIFENTHIQGQNLYCVSPDELNYYLGKFDYIKNSLKPIGKTYKNVLVEDDFGTTGGNFPIIHRYKLFYGVNIGSNPN